MPLQESQDFGANFFNPTNNSARFIHNHLFPGGNTGLAFIRNDTNLVKTEGAFLKGSVRVDIFGIKEGGSIDSPLAAPLRPKVPTLKRGLRYLIEVVLRTVSVGHPFTQGTVDSNEVWVESKVKSGDKIIGGNGGLGPHKEVDPWSHFINVYMLDRDGNRIDRRNPQDIFTPLYNHQIPPGAGQVVHYDLVVPQDQNGPLTVEVKLQYRKFDTLYMNYVFDTNYVKGAPFTVTNDLPIVTIAADAITFPVEGMDAAAGAIGRHHRAILQYPRVATLERLRHRPVFRRQRRGGKGRTHPSHAKPSSMWRSLGRADGPVNLARVYFKEGRLEDTVAALQRASQFNPPAPRWTVAWFNGLVDKQNGFFDKAIAEFRSILE